MHRRKRLESKRESVDKETMINYISGGPKEVAEGAHELQNLWRPGENLRSLVEQTRHWLRKQEKRSRYN